MTSNVRRASASADDLPYRYREEAIEFEVEEFSVNGGEPGTADADRSVPLYKYEPWEEASLSVSMTVEEDDLDFVFDGDSPYDAKLIVVVDSEATQMRYEKVVQDDSGPDQFSAGTYKDQLELEHKLLRGAVTLTPRIVRTSNSELPYAPKKGMRVVGGEPWKVLVDESETSGVGFPFVYRDFSDGDYPEGAVHALRRNPSDPAVLVNKVHEPIVDILQTETFYSADAYLKDVIKAEMGTSTWIQLVVYTAATIAESGEPEFNWQEGVIEEISPYLYDDDPDYEIAVERLGNEFSSPNDIQMFVLNLNEAVQLYTEQAQQLNNYIKEFQ